MTDEDLQLLHYLMDMLLSQPSMFADDESFNRAVAVQERLRCHLADGTPAGEAEGDG